MESGGQPAAWGSWRPELGSTVRLLWPMTIEQVSQRGPKARTSMPLIFQEPKQRITLLSKGPGQGTWMEITDMQQGWSVETRGEVS